MVTYSRELKAMIQAARHAGGLLVERQNENLTLIAKGNNDFATQADIDAQEVITKVLQTHCPDIPIIGEEQENPKITAPTFFTVDPLDNTKPYKAGFAHGWGSIIGLVHDYQARAGVIYLPKEKELWAAEAGHGCFCNDKPRHIKYATPLRHAVIDIELGPWLDKHCFNTVIAPLTEASGMTKSCETVVGIDIVRGRLGLWAFVRSRRKNAGGIWDFTAPAILVEEAGGIATNLRGEPLRFDHIAMNGILYAANKKIHQEALRLTQKW